MPMINYWLAVWPISTVKFDTPASLIKSLIIIKCKAKLIQGYRQLSMIYL